MVDFWNKHTISVGDSIPTPFLNRDNIYQDGTTPMYRDVDGTLWAMSGHSHMGEIAVFAGRTISDLKKKYPIATNFCVGHADYAFSGVRYPEGVKPCGSIWPFGIYICPVTHRFFCFFHNETGWNGKGTGYDAYGPCQTPKNDSDFRHVGLMHSDDEGRNWTFDRWILTGEDVCFTDLYNPGAGSARGQTTPRIRLGSGDFSLFVPPDDDFIYIFYNIIGQNTADIVWESCDIFVARTRKRTDGVMGDFVKYYNGAFSEAGNLGKETAIVHSGWHPRVVYAEKYGVYLMSYSEFQPGKLPGVIRDVMAVRVGEDLLHWSDPVILQRKGERFGNHYVAMVDTAHTDQPSVLKGDDFLILTNHNGTDVNAYTAQIVNIEREKSFSNGTN